jgi:protein-disulfide isomerase
MRKMTLPVLVAAALSVFAPAMAEDSPLAGRAVEAPPALKYLQAQGVKLTYLGEDGGLKGYLGENPNGKMQTFYLSPDGNHVIAGLLFRSGGINVTGLQINDMQKRYEDARKQMEDARKQMDVPAPQAAQPQEQPKPEAQPQAAQPRAEAAPPAAPQAAAASAWLSPIDKAKFLSEVEKTAWFAVGDKDAPVLYMVADPQCPFCHKAWEEIRQQVLDHKLAVRVVLINGLSGSEPLAVSLLSRQDPGRAWLGGEGSRDGVHISPPPAQGSKEWNGAHHYLELNDNFAFNVVGIKGTPLFAYVGKDGKLYSAEGPRDLKAFMSAL